MGLVSVVESVNLIQTTETNDLLFFSPTMNQMVTVYQSQTHEVYFGGKETASEEIAFPKHGLRKKAGLSPPGQSNKIKKNFKL